MFESLKKITPATPLTLDDERANALTQKKDFESGRTRVYGQDEGEIVLIDLDEFCLVAHTFCGDPRYYVVEEGASGSLRSIETAGFPLLAGENDFRERSRLRLGGKVVGCKSHCGPVYGLTPDCGTDSPPYEVAVCEYLTGSKQYPYMFALKEDGGYTVYQGVRIPESGIVR